ncbi:MAG: AbrB/MazE/SpoVT family DNA-binding domain-containing protein [Alphaproteobacteria bacterium]
MAAHDADGDAETGLAKVFMHGRSQAVRLPKAFRVPGKVVRVRRVGRTVVLEPLDFDIEAWRAEMSRYRDVPFMEDGREQPPMPEDDDELPFDR